MPNRQEHLQEVQAFLKQNLSSDDWKFSYPHGRGRETYFIRGFKRTYFVKVGVEIERYNVMAGLGLTPPVILHGQLNGGVSIIVQSFVAGRTPERTDFRERLNDVAAIVRKMHKGPFLREVLPVAESNLYREAGLQALDRLRHKWERHKAQIPKYSVFVNNSLDHLEKQINRFSGEGLAASHGDICSANWLFSLDGTIYLVDFDLMKMDDPALDLGALLWWYYPPGLRQSFLDASGYRYTEELRVRMQVRMAMHCLNILLPREQSFDQFNPERFGTSLQDFKAVLDGEENPQGYDDHIEEAS